MTAPGFVNLLFRSSTATWNPHKDVILLIVKLFLFVMAKIIYKQETERSSTFGRFELSPTEQPPEGLPAIRQKLNTLKKPVENISNY